jgi:hypothetical protein
VLAQLLGASGAAAVLRGLFGTAGHLGATLPEPGFTSGQAFGMEVLLTFGLVSVILGVPSAAQNVGQFAAIGVGSYIVLAGLWSSPVSGASMNPARSAGPALVAGGVHQLWIYLIASPVGAIAAVGAAWILRGAGGDRTARPLLKADWTGGLTGLSLLATLISGRVSCRKRADVLGRGGGVLLLLVQEWCDDAEESGGGAVVDGVGGVGDADQGSVGQEVGDLLRPVLGHDGVTAAAHDQGGDFQVRELCLHGGVQRLGEGCPDAARPGTPVVGDGHGGFGGSFSGGVEE